jgi:hypothetical protein
VIISPSKRADIGGAALFVRALREMRAAFFDPAAFSAGVVHETAMRRGQHSAKQPALSIARK